MAPAFTFRDGPGPVVATAIHAGHDLRPELASRIALDEATRLREEDPFTDRFADVGDVGVVVHRSRFEVDLNRPREGAVYRRPEDAWGLEVWGEALRDEDVERSLDLWDRFHRELADRLDELAATGPFLVLDVHSYNHRRAGEDAPAAPATENPEVNVGTGSLDRARWARVVDRFVDDLGRQEAAGHRLDVRENVRFRGGHLARWVHDRYPATGCTLAVELKKVFMDEWTGAVDEAHLGELVDAVRAAVPGAAVELARVAA